MPVPEKARPLPSLQIHPTARCNLSCAHCYSGSGPHRQAELAPQVLVKFLGEAAGLGYRELEMTGGEPFLYAGLSRVLKAARILGMSTSVVTNGVDLPLARWAAAAPFLDRITVSIDGRPEEHDALRGMTGAYDRTIASVRRIAADDVPFGLGFTLTRYNSGSLGSVVRQAAELGARFVRVMPLGIHGRAAETMPDDRPDAIRRFEAVIAGQEAGKAWGVEVEYDMVTAGELAQFRRNFVPAHPFFGLSRAAPRLVVKADGTIVPMTYDVDEALHIGNLSAGPLLRQADRWLDDGRASALGTACDLAWHALSASHPRVPHAWLDEVAARSRLVYHERRYLKVAHSAA